MKKLYKKLMKTSALICLLILGTGNAWGELAWQGTKIAAINPLSTNGAYIVGNNTGDNSNYVYIWPDRKTSISTSSPKGLPFTNGNQLHIIPHSPTGEALLLRFTNPTNNNSITINITGTDGMNESYEINTSSGSTANTGEMIVFEITSGKTYTVSSSSDFYLNNVTLIQTSDIIDLDEEATSATNQTEIAKGKKYVRLKRTLTAGIWNTFCLPITLNYYGIQPQLRCSAYKMDSYSDNTITFTQILSENGKPRLTANTPCLIKPSKTLVNPIFASLTTSNYVNPTATSGDLSFVGVYGAENIYDADHSNFFVSNNTLKYPSDSDNGTIKGFRAYFHLANGTQIKGFAFEDGATGIITVESDPFEENANVYTIDGRNLGNTKNLSRGIYIQNGRKFVVK